MSAPIEDQLRDYFTMVDRMQGSVDTTAPTAGTPNLRLVSNDAAVAGDAEHPHRTDPNHHHELENIMLSPNRNNPPNRARTWLLVAASVATTALVGGLIFAVSSDSDQVPADEPTQTLPPAPSVTEAGGVSLIVSNAGDPFVAAVVEATRSVAESLSLGLTVVEGDGDAQTLRDAITEAIDRGDSGVMITGVDEALVPSLDAARAAGVVVVGVDTPIALADSVDATVGHDDYISGQLAGLAAVDTFGSGSATIAMLDLDSPSTEPADILRDQGFLNGFGIIEPCANIGCARDQVDETGNGNEPAAGSYTGFGSSGDFEIACHEATGGTADGGRTAMDACLLANENINVVYAVNEAAAAGAADAIDAIGRTGEVVITTVGGSCDAVQLITDGRITATAQRSPGALAELGLQAITTLADGGTLTPNSSTGDFVVPTPHVVVTDSSGDGGYNAMSSARATDVCWG